MKKPGVPLQRPGALPFPISPAERDPAASLNYLDAVQSLGV
jgi:hypothetical protein